MIFAAADTIGLTQPEQARLYLSLPKQSADSGALKDYFHEQERRSLERWRVPTAKVRVQREAFLARTDDELRDLFVDLVKNKAVGCHDAFVLSHILFGDANDVRYLASLIMCHTSHEARFRASNISMADLKYPPTFMTAHGDTIVSMPFPILPNDKRLQAINQQTLAECASRALEGGDSAGDMTATAYRQDVPVAVGGGSLQIFQGAEGTQWLDTTPLENALQTISDQVKQLKQRQPRNTSAPARSNNNNYNNNNNNNNRGRNRLPNNNRSYNNNNNNGYYKPRGGDTEEDKTPTVFQ
jgi:hypothetical protein